MAEWTIDGLRLAGRLAHRQTPITYDRIAKICAKTYEGKSPEQIAGELVEMGFLVFRNPHWLRTPMKHTKAMSSMLLGMVQNHVQRQRKNEAIVNEIATGPEPSLYRWFGSYAEHPVYRTGRIHYLEDDE